MNGSVTMHHIQKSIIISLARTSPLRFSALQPPRTPNNTFSYHLRKLIENGYVELTPKGYVATRRALKLVALDTNGYHRTQPAPPALTMIYVENSEGEVLLLNRNRKPFQGWYGIPSGLIHGGETLAIAAERELYEKTTLIADGPLHAKGVLDFRYVQETTDDVFMHIIGFVYAYKYLGGLFSLHGKSTQYGQLAWSKLDHANILPEVFAIKKIVSNGIYLSLSMNFIEPALFDVAINSA